MKDKIRRPARRIRTRVSRILSLMAAAGILALTAAPGEADTDPYDPRKAGNPVRIVAYVLHPVGVLIDYGLMRPCFWLVQQEPFSTVFGYESPMNVEDPSE